MTKEQLELAVLLEDLKAKKSRWLTLIVDKVLLALILAAATVVLSSALNRAADAERATHDEIAAQARYRDNYSVEQLASLAGIGTADLEAARAVARDRFELVVQPFTMGTDWRIASPDWLSVANDYQASLTSLRMSLDALGSPGRSEFDRSADAVRCLPLMMDHFSVQPAPDTPSAQLLDTEDFQDIRRYCEAVFPALFSGSPDQGNPAEGVISAEFQDNPELMRFHLFLARIEKSGAQYIRSELTNAFTAAMLKADSCIVELKTSYLRFIVDDVQIAEKPCLTPGLEPVGY